MFTFGSDPEFFLSYKKKFKSAIGTLPKKEKPIHKDGCYFYYDNVLAEAQMKPAGNKEETVANIGTCLSILSDIVRPNKLVLQSAYIFPECELDDEDARIAGCMPEWSAYTLEQNLPPEDIIATTGFRTAGGHIHLGENPIFENELQSLNVVRMLDLFLAVPFVLLDKDPSGKARREIYGQAGGHRRPELGRLEYRALSNYWFSSPQLVELVYDICEFTLEFVGAGRHEKYWSIIEDMLDDDDPSLAHQCFGYDKDVLQKCINTCDKKLAEMFMLIVENHVPYSIIKKINDLQSKEFDFYQEWDL